MSLSPKEQQALASVEDGLASSDPSWPRYYHIYSACVGRGDAGARDDPGDPARGHTSPAPRPEPAPRQRAPGRTPATTDHARNPGQWYAPSRRLGGLSRTSKLATDLGES